MANESINVLYLSDNHYAPFAGVSIVSLFENNKHFDAIRVFVIDDNIAEDNKQKMRQVAEQYGRELIFLDVSYGIRTLESMGAPKYRNSYTTYLKLFTLAELPADVHRVFFIDSDSVVLGSLSGLTDFDMQGNPVAAVKDILCRAYMITLGFDPNDSWYNMGMMLVDVDLWKSMQCQQMIMNQMKIRSAYVAVDQDLLNICLHGRISTLSPVYNATPHHYLFEHEDVMKNFPQADFYGKPEIEESRRHPVIHHFERFVGDSPWNKGSLHPYVADFDRYLAISPWKAYQKQPSGNQSLIFRAERLLYRVLPKRLFLKFYAFGMRQYFARRNAQLSRGGVANIQS